MRSLNGAVAKPQQRRRRASPLGCLSYQCVAGNGCPAPRFFYPAEISLINLDVLIDSAFSWHVSCTL